MDSNQSRKIILSKIKKSMEEGRDFSIPPHDVDSPVFPVPEDLLVTFSNELKAIGGHVIIEEGISPLIQEFENICSLKEIGSVYCLDDDLEAMLSDLSVEIKSDKESFKKMEVGVTRCEFLVSRTGTIVISSKHQSGRRLNVFPPIHVVFAKASQLVVFPDDALDQLEEKYGTEFPSLVSFITGASRTADIEKTLVMGAHGPKELFVFIDKNE